jgi:rubrerythrin
MASESVKDILDHAREFHRDLGAYYASLGAAADKARVRLLLDYMSAHERSLDRALSAYEAMGQKAVLGTWFKSALDGSLLEVKKLLPVRRDMSTDDVIRCALKVDRCLMQVYRRLAENAVAEDVKSLFEELVRETQKGDRRLIRDALELEDV